MAAAAGQGLRQDAAIFGDMPFALIRPAGASEADESEPPIWLTQRCAVRNGNHASLATRASGASCSRCGRSFLYRSRARSRCRSDSSVRATLEEGSIGATTPHLTPNSDQKPTPFIDQNDTQRQDPGASSTADECNRGYNTLVLGAAVCWSVPDWQQLVRRSSEIISRPSKPAAWL